MANVSKILGNNFEWIEDTSQFNEDFIKKGNEDNDEEYFFEVGVQYPGKSRDLHSDLLILPERIKIEKLERLVANLQDKTEYVIYITNLRQTLNHGLCLRKTVKRKTFSS